MTLSNLVLQKKQAIESSGRSLKVFNYLDEFKLKEYKNEDKLGNNNRKEYNGIYRLSFAADDGTIFTITINDEKHIELYVGDHKGSSIKRHYKIDNDNISSEKLEELLK